MELEDSGLAAEQGRFQARREERSQIDTKVELSSQGRGFSQRRGEGSRGRPARREVVGGVGVCGVFQ